MKTAVISPIFKSGNKTECTNYIPISILSAISKIFEKLISMQLSEYLESNEILTGEQSGFRKNHSTQSSLLQATNKWLINMDNGCLNGVIFLDLKKAFDCVDHDILLRKLYLYGSSPSTLKWFKSYLSNRTQICKIERTMSRKHTIRCGVPQGSNLGPLLFLVYINDLPRCLSHSTSVCSLTTQT